MPLRGIAGSLKVMANGRVTVVLGCFQMSQHRAIKINCNLLAQFGPMSALFPDDQRVSWFDPGAQSLYGVPSTFAAGMSSATD